MLSSIYYGCKLEQESKNYIYEMQKERYKVFKSQDSTNEQFDVIFEIEGKKIYASKYVLISVSEYMNAFLSDRWLKKDEVIKIETYSYDSFYQFLCFLYSGHCHLTTQNVYELTDMAESYAVSCLKDFCDKYCFRMDKTIESIEELTEFALKYSLPQLTHSIKSFIMNNSDKVYNNETFIAFKKPFVEFVSSIYRVHDSRLKRFENSSVDGNRNESGFFESIYNWAEHQVMKQKDSNDCNVNLLEAVKAELSNILPGIKYCNMRFDFLMNFVVEKGFILSPAEFKEIHSGCFAYNSYHVEKRFKCIYELAEKQASQKQKMSPIENFNIVDSIKTDLAEVLSDLKFGKMGKEFLMNFVVVNGIITEEQVKHVYDTKVRIQNDEKSIHGLIKGDLGIRLASETTYCNNYVDQYNRTTITRFSKFYFSVPKTPSTLMKMKGCDWYLCLEKDGFLAFKHHTIIMNTDYLLAEMKSEAEFNLNENSYTYIYAEYVNLSDINDNDSNMRSQLSSIKSTSAAQTTTIQRESIEEKPDWGDAHEDFGEIYKNNEETDLGDVRNKYTTRPPPATNNSLFGGLNKTGETLTFNPGNVVKESEPAKTTPSNNFLFGGLNKTGGTLSFNIGNKESEASQPAASSKPLFGGLAKSGGTSNFTSGKPEKESESPQTIQSNNSLFGSSGKPASTLSFNFGNKDTEPSKMTPTSNPLFGALVKPGGTFTFNSGKSDKESESPQTLPSNTTLFNGLVKPGGLFNSKAPETSTSTSAATNGESNNKDNGEDGDAEDAPPPKIEIIKHEEPGAVFSTKCSLFNFVNNEYKKVGIGFLHIKKTDSGTQLLIRAATALGTVWINTYINSFFKAEKKGKNKIQFSYPSTKGAKTSFVRVVDVDDAVAYLTGVKKP